MRSAAQTVLLLFHIVTAKKCTENPLAVGDPITEPTDPPGVDPPKDWPRGRFTLLRAGDSCIRNSNTNDGIKFKSGWRYQDTEDDKNANEWPKESLGLGNSTGKKDGIKLNFCSKMGKEAKGKVTTTWPEGNYCIFMSGRFCPPKKNSWKTGAVTWDDEDDNNANYQSGRLPAGDYTADTTTYRFCCRDDGDPLSPILLPTSVPFYLFRFTDRCQRVAFMDVTEETVLWDDEDTDGQDAQTGDTPLDTGGRVGHRLHLCLYTPRASVN